MLLGLILSAVMVTGYSIKDHIANERNIQADAAAADPVNATEAKQNATQAANAVPDAAPKITMARRDALRLKFLDLADFADAVSKYDGNDEAGRSARSASMPWEESSKEWGRRNGRSARSASMPWEESSKEWGRRNGRSAHTATKNIQADEVADEADDEDADKNACETYPENACVNGVAYGCKKEGMHAMYCWSSCTTIAGNVGFQWLRVPAPGYFIQSKSLQCDPTKPGDDLDLQCVGKADLSHSKVCYPSGLGKQN